MNSHHQVGAANEAGPEACGKIHAMPLTSFRQYSAITSAGSYKLAHNTLGHTAIIIKATTY
jgi:hypothetical protein